jgi:nitroreductase
MQTSKSIIELIKSRSSIRNYIDKPLSSTSVIRIKELISEKIKTPFGSDISFKLVENSKMEGQKPIGTYGMITGANSYIAGKVKKSGKNLEDFGYALEKIILYLTDMGLGTCWLGGTFNREEFKKILELQDDEIIPAVTPVGPAGKKFSIKSMIIRFIIKAKKRKTWNELFFNEAGSPLSDAGLYETPLEMIRLAPSASNKQPWRIVRENDSFHFIIERLPSYQERLKEIGVDIQRLDMGIAMCHFELTCSHLNLYGEWKVIDNPKIPVINNSEYIISWKIKH